MGAEEDEAAKKRHAKERKDEKIPTVESWNDADCKLVVTQPEGWTCRVSLQTKVHMPPDELYELLTQPDNSKVFRNIKALKDRRVLEDDGRGRQLVAVEQEANWKFLCFGGRFTTKLLVDQNRRSGQIGFKLVEAGMMKKFEGTWKIQPFTQATLDSNAGFKPKQKHWFRPGQALQGFQNRFGRHEEVPEASLLTLEQSVLPNAVPPKPLDRLLKGIAARQVRGLVEDVRREVERRKAEIERQKPHPSSSAAPLASLVFRLRPQSNAALPRPLTAARILSLRRFPVRGELCARPLPLTWRPDSFASAAATFRD